MPAKKATKKTVKKTTVKKVEKKSKAIEPKKKAVIAKLLDNKIIIEKGYDEFVERNFGKLISKRLELAFVEGLYLLEKEKITLKKASKKVKLEELLDFGLVKDPRLHEKYIVYRDIRDRGLVAKTGFKFGCDFRVYKRGVGVIRGPKKPEEHTKWIVFAVPEDYTCAFTELSRAVRLAHSIRARMLWAIVDNENDVTYYEVLRMKP